VIRTEVEAEKPLSAGRTHPFDRLLLSPTRGTRFCDSARRMLHVATAGNHAKKDACTPEAVTRAQSEYWVWSQVA